MTERTTPSLPEALEMLDLTGDQAQRVAALQVARLTLTTPGRLTPEAQDLIDMAQWIIDGTDPLEPFRAPMSAYDGALDAFRDAVGEAGGEPFYAPMPEPKEWGAVVEHGPDERRRRAARVYSQNTMARWRDEAGGWDTWDGLVNPVLVDPWTVQVPAAWGDITRDQLAKKNPRHHFTSPGE